jgi:hypothetical protein
VRGRLPPALLSSFVSAPRRPSGPRGRP